MFGTLSDNDDVYLSWLRPFYQFVLNSLIANVPFNVLYLIVDMEIHFVRCRFPKK